MWQFAWEKLVWLGKRSLLIAFGAGVYWANDSALKKSTASQLKELDKRVDYNEARLDALPKELYDMKADIFTKMNEQHAETQRSLGRLEGKLGVK